ARPWRRPSPGRPAHGPRRRSLVETPSEPVVEAADPLPGWVSQFPADPDIALLRRLRDALEASL
ncbi:hypothetical protein ACWDPI_24950, partial [Streptomyces zhihengii]